jgi:hypothetical protein
MDPDDFGRCTGLTLSFGYAPALQLQWSPADCAMFEVSIDQGQTIMWHLSTVDTRNGIESPLTYGVAPPGTSGTTAQTMGPGRYRIVMTRINAESRVVLAADQELTIP